MTSRTPKTGHRRLHLLVGSAAPGEADWFCRSIRWHDLLQNDLMPAIVAKVVQVRPLNAFRLEHSGNPGFAFVDDVEFPDYVILWIGPNFAVLSRTGEGGCRPANTA